MTDPRALRTGPDRSPDPSLDQPLDELLRSCVQCGLCLPHCATFLATGNEVQSPRGRLILLREMLDHPQETATAYLAAFDQCIGCHACEAACPSGVPFTLLEYGQEQASRRLKAADLPDSEPVLPKPLLQLLDRRPVLKTAQAVTRIARRFLEGSVGPDWRRRAEAAGGLRADVARMLGTLPATVESDADLLAHIERREAKGDGPVRSDHAARPAETVSGPLPDVAFFRGCANDALLAPTSRRLLEVLAAIGCRVRVPGGQECCGALASHTGSPQRAERLREGNLRAFEDLGARERILIEAAGCGMEWKSRYPGLTDRVADAVCLLAVLPAPALGAVPLRVAVHDPCHARHGQGIHAEPRRLLRRIPGLDVAEPAESEVCCGSGGAWGLRYPELSAELGRRKAARLAETGADVVVTSNPGCLGQIADGLALEAPELLILPLTDLYWVSMRRALAE